MVIVGNLFISIMRFSFQMFLEAIALQLVAIKLLKSTAALSESYRLDGLDETNSNARNRNIVLHSHSCVPDFDTELKICQSGGCPTLSPAFLDQLEPLIEQESNPVLMWMYSTSRED